MRMTATQVIPLIVLSIVGFGLIAYGVVALVRIRARRLAAAGETPGTARPQTKNRTGLAVAALFFGLAPLLFVADVIMVHVTDGRVSLNGPWLAGVMGGVLTPATVTFLLGILVLAWWPRDPKGPRRFIDSLKNPRTRGPLLWDISRTAVVLLALVLGFVVGFWLSVLVVSMLSGAPAGINSFISLVILLAAIVLFGTGANRLFVKLVPRPTLAPVEHDPRVAKPQQHPTDEADPRAPKPPPASTDETESQ